MSSSLKDKLIADLGGDKIDIELVPVDSSNGAPKVYQIEIGGKMFFDWVMTPPNPPDVKLAPAESWKTPINFETHDKFFGPGLGQEGGEAKDEMYKTLKQAIAEAK